MQIERRAIVDREQWLEWRKLDVTASTVGALPQFNCHPYVTPLRLFVEKCGVEFIDQDNGAKRRGRWMEPAIAEAVREEAPQWNVVAPKLYLREPSIRIGATPDFIIEGDPRGPGILQCKSVAPHVWHQWLEGTEPPTWVLLQTLTEAMLGEAAFAAIAVMLIDPFKTELRIHELPRHPAVEAGIIRSVESFWRDVGAGREPAADYSRDRETLEALAPREQAGKPIDLSGHNHLPVLLAERARLKKRAGEIDDRCTEIENEVRDLMGDAEYITGIPDWRITWRNSKRAGYTVPPKESRKLTIIDRRPPNG
jgi:predicted phage-related endonuclease